VNRASLDSVELEDDLLGTSRTAWPTSPTIIQSPNGTESHSDGDFWDADLLGFRGAELSDTLSCPKLASNSFVKVLVVDIGGSHIKLALAGTDERAQFDSSPDLTPHEVFNRIIDQARNWAYDVVSIGYPGRVGPAGPVEEPGKLGTGWVGFDFEAAFGKPIRIVNDAVMQALGAYDGKRMLFLGLGTGLGSALITERVAVPLELGQLYYRDSGTLVETLGREGLERIGQVRWHQAVFDVTAMLRRAFLADYVVLGGGNAARIDHLPPHTRCGGNEDAIEGGHRLWQETVEPHDREPSPFWRVVQ
jgi:polyphosphate glucokinase